MSLVVRLMTICCLVGGLIGPAAAQSLVEDVHPLVRRDGSVYLVHTLGVAPGEGVEVYRSVDGGPEQRITEAPLRPVSTGAGFAQALGPVADEIRGRMQVATFQESLLMLRARPVAAALYSYLYPEVAEALGRGYFDLEVPSSTAATYRVVVVDDLGRPTGGEATKTVRLAPFSAPPPTSLSATHEGRRVTLSWSYATAHPVEVIAFHVYGGTPGAGARRLGAPRVTRNQALGSFSLTFDVPAFATASFFVTAQDISGQQSAPSEVLTYAISDNEAPAVVSGIAAEMHPAGGIVVTWSPAESADIVTYRLQRARQIAGPYEVIADLSAATTGYHDTSVPAGRHYAYRIEAVDGAGNTGPASLAASVHYIDRQAPEPPGALEAVAENDSLVTLTWTPTPSPDLRTYMLLRRRLGRGGVPVDAQLSSDDLTAVRFVDNGEAGRGFVEGATYLFGVAARDSSGNVSDTVFARVQIPDLTPPQAPSLLRAATDGFRVQLTWNPTGSADAVRYRLYRGRGEDAVPVSLLQELARGTTFARDEAVQSGTTYTYHLTAVDSLGNESPPSVPATILMQDGAPPRQVRGVRAAATSDGVQLAWEPSRAADFAGYHVFRADRAADDYELVTPAPLTEPVWSDPQGAHGVWYHVRAVDTSGLASRPSDPAQAQVSER